MATSKPATAVDVIAHAINLFKGGKNWIVGAEKVDDWGDDDDDDDPGAKFCMIGAVKEAVVNLNANPEVHAEAISAVAEALPTRYNRDYKAALKANETANRETGQVSTAWERVELAEDVIPVYNDAKTSYRPIKAVMCKALQAVVKKSATSKRKSATSKRKSVTSKRRAR